MKVKDLIEKLMTIDPDMPVANVNWYPEYCCGEFYPCDSFHVEIMKLAEDEHVDGALKQNDNGKEYLLL